jgi:hypothetical protein
LHEMLLRLPGESLHPFKMAGKAAPSTGLPLLTRKKP